MRLPRYSTTQRWMPRILLFFLIIRITNTAPTSSSDDVFDMINWDSDDDCEGPNSGVSRGVDKSISDIDYPLTSKNNEDSASALSLGEPVFAKGKAPVPVTQSNPVASITSTLASSNDKGRELHHAQTNQAPSSSKKTQPLQGPLKGVPKDSPTQGYTEEDIRSLLMYERNKDLNPRSSCQYRGYLDRLKKKWRTEGIVDEERLNRMLLDHRMRCMKRTRRKGNV
ncbi:hypothetical protein H0H93_006214 [Arthromyces matolae]|nr:hypothetical protein H0H93_006214 [Arthromyces matolae]